MRTLAQSVSISILNGHLFEGKQWRYICLIGISIPEETRDNRLAEAAQLRSRGLIKLHIGHD